MPSATRITNLDFIRGVALLGIIVINVILFCLIFKNLNAMSLNKILNFIF